MLAYAREGYRRRDVDLRELAGILGDRGFLRLAGRYWQAGGAEMVRDLSLRLFLRALQRYTPGVTLADLAWGPSGIRAQALRRNGALVEDFAIAGGRTSCTCRTRRRRPRPRAWPSGASWPQRPWDNSRSREGRMAHVGAAELAAGLDTIRAAPAEVGALEMLVRRPVVNGREVVEEALLTADEGLVGDYWLARGSESTPGGAADPDRQLTVMGSRVVDLLTDGDRTAWPLAGDQLYVDLDLSIANLPAGTQLAIGDVVIEVTEPAHTGCAKFSARFGSDALRFVNSPEGRALRLRGLNARVVRPGTVRRGDAVLRLAPTRGAGPS